MLSELVANTTKPVLEKTVYKIISLKVIYTLKPKIFRRCGATVSEAPGYLIDTIGMCNLL